VLFAGSYAVAAYSTLPRAIAGLGIMGIGAATYVVAGHALASDQPVFGGYEIILAPAIVLFAEILALWLTGLFVRARRQSALLAARNAELDRAAERAVAAERTRIARELHDIVAHHISVVILQAAGSRASGKPSLATLEKIENSGRQALTETRRLLNLLRGPRESSGLVPQPGIGALAELADSVRSAGLPVRLVVDGDHATVPAAVEVSVYRIVQEALTNVLKHAGTPRTAVTVNYGPDELTLEVTDDGPAEPGHPAALPGAGRGLAGLRERVYLSGGEFEAGRRPGGGWGVIARFPANAPAPAPS